MNKLSVKVSGISFSLKDDPSLSSLEIIDSDFVSLCKEPNNKYDSKAIRVEYKGKKLGYISRKQEGYDFSVQDWCHDNFDFIKARIDRVWYKNDSEISENKIKDSELAGVSINLEIPKQKSISTDKIITKKSFSEPEIIVDFNDTQHVYNMRCPDGYKILKGGTTFIKRFYKPFDSLQISRQCSKYWGVDSNAIQNLWVSNGELAGLLGTTIHNALEHYINFRDVGQKITETRKKSGKDQKENYALPKHPFLKKVIKSLNTMTDKLDKQYGVEQVVAEALITDSATGWGGLVDRLAIIDSEKKIARIQDYKVNINAEVIESHNKPLPPFDYLPANKLTKYTLQMSFYGALLEKHGWTIEGLDVFIFEDKWVHRELDMVDYSILKKS